MKRFLLLAAVAVLGACTAESPLAPRSAPASVRHDLTCRSGYIVAYDENGEAYCAPAGPESGAQSRPIFPGDSLLIGGMFQP
jgi:hypothetical protein